MSGVHVVGLLLDEASGSCTVVRVNAKETLMRSMISSTGTWKCERAASTTESNPPEKSMATLDEWHDVDDDKSTTLRRTAQCKRWSN